VCCAKCAGEAYLSGAREEFNVCVSGVSVMWNVVKVDY
jgi:hypothetical protein